MSHRSSTGTCTDCGKENCRLTVLDDVVMVCDECLNTDYTQCDICGEYWNDTYVEFTFTEDERIICAYCMEDLDDDGNED